MKTNSVWHGNTSPTTYDKALPPLTTPDGQPVYKETATGKKVHAVFASAGPLAELGAYAYALKLPYLPKDDKNTAPTRGNIYSVVMLYDTVLLIIDNKEAFLKRLESEPFSGHVYELSVEGFTQERGTEYICEGHATIKQRVDLHGTKAPTTVMQKGVQIFFAHDPQAMGTYVRERDNLISAAKYCPEKYDGKHWALYHRMVKSGELIHYNQEMAVNPVDFVAKQAEKEKGLYCHIL